MNGDEEFELMVMMLLRMMMAQVGMRGLMRREEEEAEKRRKDVRREESQTGTFKKVKSEFLVQNPSELKCSKAGKELINLDSFCLFSQIRILSFCFAPLRNEQRRLRKENSF